MDKVNILGINVDRIGIKDAADKIFEFLGGDRCAKVFTPNGGCHGEGQGNGTEERLLHRYGCC